MLLLRDDMTLSEFDELEREGWDALKPDAQADLWGLAREAIAAREEQRRRQDADLDAPTAATPAEARAMFGAKLEEFARTLGGKAKDLDIPGFACIVMTDAGINVVSGGTHDEWRPMMRRIAGRVSDEMGQVLIAKGVATKPGRG